MDHAGRSPRRSLLLRKRYLVSGCEKRYRTRVARRPGGPAAAEAGGPAAAAAAALLRLLVVNSVLFKPALLDGLGAEARAQLAVVGLGRGFCEILACQARR